MRRLLEKLEAMLTAAAFAEEGDVDTARRLLAEAEAAPAPAARTPGRGGRARPTENETLPGARKVRRA